MQLEIQYQVAGHAPDPRFVAQFIWTDGDPAAFNVVFREPLVRHHVEWSFGRELLHDGITSPTWKGLGDVRVVRHNDTHFKVELSSPDGNVEIHIRTEPVLTFILSTEQLVPTGIFEGSIEERKIFEQLDLALDAILSQAEGGLL